MLSITRLFYYLKPVIPRRIQIFLRTFLTNHKRRKYRDIWPIDLESIKPPLNWTGWPNGKKFAVILTHDVEKAGGRDKCRQVAEIEQKLGFRSSFNFVPERYENSAELRNDLIDNGFEVGVHGLNHDGRLYESQKLFEQRAARINQYLSDWGAVGFRSPAMHHNLDWIHNLNILYDASTFDTDPFEPQPDGMQTIFPFWVSNGSNNQGYVELPYTLVQDFTVFVLMREKTIRIWKEKVDWIAKSGGMVLVNVHPDYMNFGDARKKADEFPAQYYQEFLEFIKTEYEGQYWHVLPRELAEFWTKNYSKING